MLLIDDLLASPLRALFFVLKEVHTAVQAERAAQQRRLVAELAELNRQLDHGLITEVDFVLGEDRLLRLLDGMRGESETDGDGRERH